jgi:protein TonB
MFEKGYVSLNGSSTKSALARVMSVVIHLVMLGALLLMPLLFTNSLPATMLRQYFAAPSPPPGPPPPPSVVKVVHTEIKKFKLPDDKLYQPPAIPKELPPADELPVLPPVAECRGCVPGGDPQGVPFGVPYSPPPIRPPAVPPTPPKVETSKAATPARIRVGGNVQRAMQLSAPPPIYPQLAKAQRVQGVVKLQAVISKDGTIEQLSVLSGHPLLIGAAMDAVKKWRYKPTLLNGEPVEIITQIDVNFTLTQ